MTSCSSIRSLTKQISFTAVACSVLVANFEPSVSAGATICICLQGYQYTLDLAPPLVLILQTTRVVDSA